MKIVGLTGGIGSGKTLVADIFKHLSIPVFNADSESRNILDNDSFIHEQMTSWFGRDILTDGKPDRRRLAEIIFTDMEMLSRVNALIHPRVFERFVEWCGENRGSPYVIHEAAILFESGIYRQMDVTILVTAPEIIRISRVKQRDKMTEESIRQRMKNQWIDEEKAPLADYIIINDGETPLVPMVLAIHNKLVASTD